MVGVVAVFENVGERGLFRCCLPVLSIDCSLAFVTSK